MATEERVPEGATPAESTPKPDTVTVTAKEDCNLLINGQSVALTAGQEVEMTPEEAKAYADLGLVDVSTTLNTGLKHVPNQREGAGPSAQASEGSGVPKRK